MTRPIAANSRHHLPQHLERRRDGLATDALAANVTIAHGLVEDRLVLAGDGEVDKADAVRSKALLTDISLGAGLAIAGAGLTVFLLSDAPGNSNGVSVLPLPGGAAATGRWEF